MNEVQRSSLNPPVGFPLTHHEGLRGVLSKIATSFPSELSLEHTWDPELVREVGRITALKQGVGLHNIYAPTLDVAPISGWVAWKTFTGKTLTWDRGWGVEMVRGLQEHFTVLQRPNTSLSTVLAKRA